MIFDWNGLGDHCYFILQQKPDPLKYCNYALPFPLPIGLPFMPCDLPNQYQLSATNQDYTLQGDIYLTFEEEIGVLERILFPASHRPWKFVGKDYYQHTPYFAIRNFNICFSPSDRPTVDVYLHDKYVGKIIERTILNCCCLTQKFQQFEIYDENNEMIYKVCSKNPQRGHFIILPFWGFDTIKYDIIKVGAAHQERLGDNEEDDHIVQEEVVGEIMHLFNGLSEYTSKNDKYGISLPVGSSEEQKCLLIHCVLLIDYLLFQNF